MSQLDNEAVVNGGRQWQAKFVASGIHLAISALAFAVLMYLILLHWFPGMHFWTDGGLQGAKLLAGVDLVLGPCLTLVVYQANKSRREKCLDFSVIALIQIAALIWGVQQVYSQRIAGTAFLEQRVFPVLVTELAEQGATLEDMRAYNDNKLPQVFIRAVSFRDGSFETTMQYIAVPRYSHVHLFENWLERLPQAQAAGGLDVKALVSEYPIFAEELKAYLLEAALESEDLFYFEYHGRYARRVLAFDKLGNLVKVLPYFDPMLADAPPEML